MYRYLKVYNNRSEGLDRGDFTAVVILLDMDIFAMAIRKSMLVVWIIEINHG